MIAKPQKNKRQQKVKDKFFKILLSIFTLLILSALIFSNWKISKKRTEFQVKIKFLQEKIQRLEKEKEKYENEVLEIDKKEYWERYLKENLNLKKKGENVVAFVLPEEEIEPLTKENSETKSSFFEVVKQNIAGLVEWFNVTFPR